MSQQTGQGGKWNRGQYSHGPNYSGRGSNYSGQRSNYSGRGSNYSGRGSSYSGRGSNYNGRGSNYSGRRFNHSGRGYYRNRGGAKSPSNRGSSQQSRGVPVERAQTLPEVFSPYSGWKLYFPQEVYSDHSPAVARIQVFEKYFLSWKALYNNEEIELQQAVTVDYKELLADPIISDGLPDLSQEMKHNPETITSCLGLAMHQMLKADLDKEMRAYNEEDPIMTQDAPLPPHATSIPMITARIINYYPVISLKHLKANYYGKFVSVKGTVVRVSNIKPQCTKMAFECTTCSTCQQIILPDWKYLMPTKCVSAECNSRTFLPKRSHPLTETIDWQKIRVQEIIIDDHRESGRIPRTVDCELSCDLVDSCVTGDMVTVSGVVKVLSSEEGRKSSNKDKCLFLLYIQANSLVNAKGKKASSSHNADLAMDFTVKELYAIQEIHSDKNLFRLIVSSLCPSIYGHEMVKAGLALGVVGGTQKFANDQNRIPVRGEPHVLIVGDPGLGKSQMLQSVSNVAPRSVYVCGNTTTTSGLTVTLCKEGASGDYALEAGALVLADHGCCCIDEFDKMTNQHQALLEAMEQQSISIAKAGIVCSLPARTSILAAANPVGGHYNKAKTVSENLKMGSALLSRFDLVFILLDRPDEEMDSMLSEKVMALHGGRKKEMTSSIESSQAPEDEEAHRNWLAEKPLSERLKVPRMENFDPIPSQLLRKYIGYARKFVHPKLGSEAASVIQKFYLDLRKKHQSQDSTPITTRQLESLIRLSEARAKLELREEVTEQDAQDVVEIMKYSMLDTFMDEFGFLDFSRSQHGSGMSKQNRAKKFIASLQRISEQNYNALFTMQEMRQICQNAGLQVHDFEEFISSLNTQGYLLKKGPRVYQLQTAGY